MKSTKMIAIFLAAAFFVAGLLTLPHYGINWDTINHLSRGQAYLNYFLTGKKDFSNRPPFFEGWPGPDGDKGWYLQDPNNLLLDADRPKSEVSSRSMYEHPTTPMSYYQNEDGGHPPLSDILSSVFNRILFGELRLVNDVDSYRIYGILLAAALVGLVFYWMEQVYGSFAGFVATLSLALYPLFWSESHFNTEKDIPETVYWSFLLFSVWKGATTKNWRWILASGVFFGLALGTKFNVLFAPLVILPWLIASSPKLFAKRWFIVSGFAAVVIGLTIFIGSWPYLWPDIIERVPQVFGFYKKIGTGAQEGFNIYPLQWIFYTTPIIILVLAILGIFFAKKNSLYFLFLLWFVVPIGRVVWPGTTTYGGVRQLMEYIPALAIFAGLGAERLLAICPRQLRLVVASAVVLPFVFLILTLTKIHPNENVYFNRLIGGLAGAKERQVPYWGFSFGAPYRQGALWLNENTPPGADVAYVYELIPNLPRIFLRPDLNLYNQNRSGYLRRGEYAMTLVYDGTAQRSYYDMYLDRFIEPVYEIKVDDVTIFAIWKNDDEHLKVNWEEEIAAGVGVQEETDSLTFDLGVARKLSRLEITYSQSSCAPMDLGYVQISYDRTVWDRLPGNLPDTWRIFYTLGEQPKDGYLIEPFVGQEARFVKVTMSPTDSCLKNVTDFKLYYFVDK
ncbi:hypothetical protein A2630_02270 [Candidatus Woesebacteria bacterium RIFCSPHIGHO2_01_FULL_44_10]|uniref:Glycosyltransferase RgtA/B/C/D-like domain-containing protein n=1 Tax=Candidatus Woesebacteria bacterium RIFCSPLOWO2_01_FULL_44_14 TaxID=1802525 RepID=A0A1F8C0N5_9BACT|nr:MAG: hypothetical protein A2630_02270 [Candidatus Woesebacteria bacterium RIFCSPHIGHO2_01_FULL_44_10]OGM53953.1 MAG: hypothetical protein A3F62_00070 [Candidatus Woesebacteria bacterium RIFCSPHIGHO2_12_FULL_44_11]OGM69921.1 MAG: hypothetical protein A2975_04910 [Candidatus Woesebacteria bacterium RIFCSPLOWO2_01_FULL_44_14]